MGYFVRPPIKADPPLGGYTLSDEKVQRYMQ